MSKRILFILILLFHSASFSQESTSTLKRKLTGKKWVSLINNRFKSPYAVGDTISFAKAYRNRYPFKMKRNGQLKQISKRKSDFSCGTFSRFESMFQSKWRPDGKWEITSKEGDVFLFFEKNSYRLFDLKNLKFIYLGNAEQI